MHAYLNLVLQQRIWWDDACPYVCIYTIIMKISERYTLKNNKRRWRHQHWICYRAAMNQGNEALHTENGIIFVYPFVGAFVMKCVRMPDSQSQYRPVNQMLPTKLEKWFASLLPQCFMMRNTVIFVATWVNIVAGRQWCNHSIFTHKTTSYERSLHALFLSSFRVFVQNVVNCGISTSSTNIVAYSLAGEGRDLSIIYMQIYGWGR